MKIFLARCRRLWRTGGRRWRGQAGAPPGECTKRSGLHEPQPLRLVGVRGRISGRIGPGRVDRRSRCAQSKWSGSDDDRARSGELAAEAAWPDLSPRVHDLTGAAQAAIRWWPVAKGPLATGGAYLIYAGWQSSESLRGHPQARARLIKQSTECAVPRRYAARR
ncbi:hypothetical protein VTN49DRAFT_203 [Thermomyces lanuginosus]|uniref:uncharacterized protein n=1 Tax=Thermomyces lanuginosus TaxID=5541 RepID=UPI003744A610